MFISVDPFTLEENVFHLLDRQWMLITATHGGRINPMTASWGGLGILWNLPVATIYVRPSRFTDALVRESEGFTLTFYKESHRKILNACGTLSGREGDKASRVGLTPCTLPDGRPAFKEARLALSCRTLYAHRLIPEHFRDPGLEAHYPEKDHHHIYIGEITAAFRQKI